MKKSILLFTFCLLSAFLGFGATPNPTNGILYVKTVETGTGDGSSWDNAFGDLSDALKYCWENNGTHVIKEIYVAGGTYSPKYDPAEFGLTVTYSLSGTALISDKTFLLPPNVKLYGGFNAAAPEATPEARTWLSSFRTKLASLDTTGIVGSPTILTGDINGINTAFHVVMVTDSNEIVKNTYYLDGFKITNGLGTAEMIVLYINGLTCKRYKGQGFFGYTSDKTSLTMQNNQLMNNSTSGVTESDGAGMHIEGGNHIISYNQFINNSARSGAGMYVKNGSHTISNNQIAGNVVTVGGGGMCVSNGNHTISFNYIVGNSISSSSSSFNADGGGLYLLGTGVKAVQNTVSKNKAIATNIAARGGGIYSSSAILLNNTVYNNFAQGSTYARGQEVYSANASKIYNNIIYNSTTDTALYVGTNTAEIKNNLLSDTAIIGNTTASRLANNLLGIYPEFADTNAATLDLRLKTSSPAINKGSNTLYQSATGINPAIVTDADGNPRLYGCNIDIGAFEVQDVITPSCDGILYVKADASGTDYGDSWDNAIPDLSDALKYCWDNPYHDVKEIYVAGGTYAPKYDPADYGITITAGTKLTGDKTFLLPPNVKIYGGFDATNPEATLEARAWLAGYRAKLAAFDTTNIPQSPTILSGALSASDTAFHVVMLVDTNKIVKNEYHFDGFQITDGRARVNSTITFAGVTHSRLHGAGMYVYTSDSVRLSLQNNRLEGNSAVIPSTELSGGGLYVNGGSHRIVDNLVVSNSISTGGSYRAYGGGMYVNNGSHLISGNLFVGNAASAYGVFGGGMYVLNGSHLISGNLFAGNIVSSSSSFVYGGGLSVQNGSHRISNNLFTGNISSAPVNASANGGGLYVQGTDNVVFQNILSGNRAESSSNNAFGGGIYSDKASLLNNSLYNNYVQGYTQSNTRGQEVYSLNASKIYNNLIYNPVRDAALYVATNTALIKNNLLSDSEFFGSTRPANLANNLLGADPLFVGADTGNFSLSLFSPAINAGDTALFREIMGFNAKDTVDAVEKPRLFGNQLDIGAFELQILPQYITFRWKASDENKTIGIKATAGTQNIQVDWGNGTKQFLDANGYSEILTSVNYGRTDTSYTVQIRVMDVETNFLGFRAQNTEIDSIVLANLSKLEQLQCDSNTISSIDISELPELRLLRLGYNNLTKLDISNNLKLETLNARDNAIDSMDIVDHTKLITVSLSNNKLKDLKIGDNRLLMELYCSNNELTELNLDNLVKLRQLGCSNNALTDLNLTAMPKLINLYISANNLSSLDISANDTLQLVSAARNQLPLSELYPLRLIDSLELSPQRIYDTILTIDTIHLTDQMLWGGARTQVALTTETGGSVPDTAYTFASDSSWVLIHQAGDYRIRLINDSVYDNTAPVTVNMYYQIVPVQSIRFTWTKLSGQVPKVALKATAGTENIRVDWGNGDVEYMDGEGNDDADVFVSATKDYTAEQSYDVIITAVDRNTDITYLVLSEILSEVSKLNVSEAAKLTAVECFSHKLDSLDLSNNLLLEIAYCYNNGLEYLNLGDNEKLKILACFENELTALDVSGAIALESLICHTNKLTSLNVANNKALEELYCYDNLLTEIDLSENTALVDLAIYQNALSSLDLSANTNLQYLSAENNRMLLSALNPLYEKYVNDVMQTVTISGQVLFDTAVSSQNIDLTSEAEFGTPAEQTNFVITYADGSSASGRYTFVNNVLVFSAPGDYKVVMTNPEIQSGVRGTSFVSAVVTIYYHIQQAPQFSFNWKGSSSDKTFGLTVKDSLEVQINWGDASANEFAWIGGSENKQVPSHNYGDEDDYTVTVSLLSTKPEVTQLDIRNKQVSALSIATLTTLEYLYADTNMISNLAINALTSLKELRCGFNQLAALDVSANINLTNLTCRNNQLSTLNVNGLKNLRILNCGYNALTQITLSDTNDLRELYCSNNVLTSLQTDSLKNIRVLSCSDNLLDSLVLTNMSALHTLYASSNKLKTLDLSKNTGLNTLISIANNQLPLTELYPIALLGVDNTTLSPQILFDTVEGRTALDLSDQLYFGTPSAKTSVQVYRGDKTSAEGKYRFNADSSGIVFIEAGDYCITMKNDSIKDKNGIVTDTLLLYVKPVAVTAVALDVNAIVLNIDSTYQLNAEISPSNVIDTLLIWESADANIASVDNNGLIKAKAQGTTKIVVKTNDGGLTDTCTVQVWIPVQSLSLDITEAELWQDSTLQLTATVLPDTADNKTLVWSSADENIATVSTSGLVKALEKGSVKIIVKTVEGNFTDTCDIEVKRHVAAVSLNKQNLSLWIDSTETLTAGILPEDADNKNTSWESVDPAIASVDADGKVKGLSAGQTKIVVKTNDLGFSDTCVVEVKAHVSSVSLDINQLTLNEDSTHRLTAAILPTDAHNKTLNWYSTDDNVATVVDGLIKAHTKGFAKIIVVTEDLGLSDTCELEVRRAVRSVVINEQTSNMMLNTSRQLYAEIYPLGANNQNVTWSSTETSVATVDQNGLVEAVGLGNSLIIVTTEEGGFKDTCRLTVVNDEISVTGVSLNKHDLLIHLNEYAQLSATITPANATNTTLIWMSSDTNTVHVSASGFLTAKAYGRARITVTTVDGGFEDYCNVYVPDQVALDTNTSVEYIVINGDVYYFDENNKLDYLMPCNNETILTIEVVTLIDSATVSRGYTFDWTVTEVGLSDLTFTVYSSDNSRSSTYTVKVEKRFNFNDIVVQKWNNTLIINNNPSNNGGFEFKAYEWYRNGTLIGTKGFYSVGPNKEDNLDPADIYSAKMLTVDNVTLQTCPSSNLAFNVLDSRIYPNPVMAKETIHIDTWLDLELPTTLELYNLNGQLLYSQPLTPSGKELKAPAQPGIYLIKVYNSENQDNLKLIVK